MTAFLRSPQQLIVFSSVLRIAEPDNDRRETILLLNSLSITKNSVLKLSLRLILSFVAHGMGPKNVET